MVRKSGICDYVGFSSVQQESVATFFEKCFADQENIGYVAKYEREKTEDERILIAAILAKLPAFIGKYGGVCLPFTPDHIHMIKRESLDDEAVRKATSDTGAAYMASHELLFSFDSGNFLKNAQRIVHELIHFSSWQSVERTGFNEAEKTLEFELRRVGFEIHNRHGESFFKDINEAITVELQKRFDNEYFESMPLICDQVRRRNEIRKTANGKADDIVWISEGVEGEQGTTYQLEWYTYNKEREAFWLLVNEIYQQDPVRFRSQEEVFELFARAAMTGRLLAIARFIRQARGKGAFRVLGHETKKNE